MDNEVMVVEIPEFTYDAQVSKVTSNIQEFKKVIIPRIQEMSKEVVTVETVPQVKKTIANLNKAKKEVTSARKELKDRILEDYYTFESETKEILGTIDFTVDTLKKQVEGLLGKEVEERRLDCLTYIAGELEVLPLEISLKFNYNPKWWENKSYAKGKFKSEVAQEIERLKGIIEARNEAIKTIAQQVKILYEQHDIQLNLKDSTMRYYETYLKYDSLSSALNELNKDVNNIVAAVRFEAEKQEHIKQEEIAKAREEERSKTVQMSGLDMVGATIEGNAIDRTLEPQAPKKITIEAVSTPPKFNGKMYERLYSFKGSYGECMTLKRFLDGLSALPGSTFSYQKEEK